MYSTTIFAYTPLKTWITLIILLSFSICHAQEPEVDSRNLEFVANHGQWHPAVRYQSRLLNGMFYLRQDGFTYDLMDIDIYLKAQEYRHDHPRSRNNPYSLKKHAVEIQFLGLTTSSRIEEKNVQAYYYNYFLGNDRSRWVSGIHPTKALIYHNIYSGVDLRIQAGDELKYEWVISGNQLQQVKEIASVIRGADSLKLDEGNLLIHTSVGTIKEAKPYSYQILNGQRFPVDIRYQLRGDTLSYQIYSELVDGIELVIDPQLIFSTYSGSVGDNFGYTATYDSKGSLYAGGIVDGRGPYPVTPGAYDTVFHDGVGRSPVNLACDISISKYNSNGDQLLWATYLGGVDDEYPHSLVVDRDDQLLLLGTTHSDSFPVTSGAYDTTYNGRFDIVVSKFSEDGQELLASTYVGGEDDDGLVSANSPLAHNYADDFRGDIIPDDDFNVFVASNTKSDNLVTVSPTQPNLKGVQDAFIFELNPDLSEMNWATYLGGGNLDASYSIKLDLQDNIYVGGGSNSDNIAAIDTAYQMNRAGSVDGYIAVFDKESKALKGFSYYGTPAYDQIYFIDLDRKGFVYATGQTEGSINKVGAAYGEDDKGQFIFKIDTSLLNLQWQTTFGNTDNKINLAPSAFLVDVCEHIYFSGWGSDIAPSLPHPGSTNNMETTNDAEQRETDNNDFYILVLDKDASGLLYATYFGGDSTADHVDGGTSRFDKKGVIYQSVCSSCPGYNSIAVNTKEINDFPVSAGAAFTYNSSVRCSNASFKIDLQIKTAVVADFTASPVIGCTPLQVDFENKSVLGNEWLWDFGDNSTSTAINPSHTYSEPGLYEVTLTVIDSNTCNISDVYKRRILVIDKGLAKFELDYNACLDKLTIENQSEGALEYLWDFGDSSTSVEEDPNHFYEKNGNYTIRLIVNPNSFCADTFDQEIQVEKLGNQDFTLYNVFTPNFDGDNDCFQFDGLSTFCKGIRWKVYNRWGELVFETSDPNECWNGEVHNFGPDLPGGTYYYILDLDPNSLSSQDLISGTITLIR